MKPTIIGSLSDCTISNQQSSLVDDDSVPLTRQGLPWTLLYTFLHAGSSMRMATRRTSVSSTERWSTVTPSSLWWPSLKPWPASRSTTAALQEWWDAQTCTSLDMPLYSDMYWHHWNDSTPHMQTPQTSIQTDERSRLREISAAAAQISTYASHSSSRKPLSL